MYSDTYTFSYPVQTRHRHAFGNLWRFCEAEGLLEQHEMLKYRHLRRTNISEEGDSLACWIQYATTCSLQELHRQLLGKNKTKQKNPKIRNQNMKTRKQQTPVKTPQVSGLLSLPTASFQISELSLYFSNQKAEHNRNVTMSALAEVLCSGRDAWHGHVLYCRQMKTTVYASSYGRRNQLW